MAATRRLVVKEETAARNKGKPGIREEWPQPDASQDTNPRPSCSERT